MITARCQVFTKAKSSLIKKAKPQGGLDFLLIFF